MIESAKEANFDILALTVDTITGGNRKRSPNWLHLASTTHRKNVIKFSHPSLLDF